MKEYSNNRLTQKLESKQTGIIRLKSAQPIINPSIISNQRDTQNKYKNMISSKLQNDVQSNLNRGYVNAKTTAQIIQPRQKIQHEKYQNININKNQGKNMRDFKSQISPQIKRQQSNGYNYESPNSNNCNGKDKNTKQDIPKSQYQRDQKSYKYGPSSQPFTKQDIPKSQYQRDQKSYKYQQSYQPYNIKQNTKSIIQSPQKINNINKGFDNIQRNPSYNYNYDNYPKKQSNYPSNYPYQKNYQDSPSKISKIQSVKQKQQPQPKNLVNHDYQFQRTRQKLINIITTKGIYTDVSIVLQKKLLGQNIQDQMDKLKDILTYRKYQLFHKTIYSAQFDEIIEDYMVIVNKKSLRWQKKPNLVAALVIKPGLIIRAKCRNYKCLCYGKVVCINYEFGIFKMGKIINKNNCPICQTPTQKGESFGYYKAKVQMEGIQNNSDRKYNIREQSKTYVDCKDKLNRNWDYLDLIVTPFRS